MILRSVPLVQGRGEQVIQNAANLFDYGKTHHRCLPAFGRRVPPDGQECIETHLQFAILVYDVQPLPDVFQLGMNLRDQRVVLVHVGPLDFAAAALLHLPFYAGLTNRTRRVVIDLHLGLVGHERCQGIFGHSVMPWPCATPWQIDVAAALPKRSLSSSPEARTSSAPCDAAPWPAR